MLGLATKKLAVVVMSTGPQVHGTCRKGKLAGNAAMWQEASGPCCPYPCLRCPT